MSRITGVLCTYQEAESIHTVLAGLAWCDEIIVVDQFSPDGTGAIAASLGARVIAVPHTGYVEAARQTGVDAATGEWIINVDADEIVHPQLAVELRRIADADEADIVRIPRKNIILGRWMRYGQWWPNAKPRFFKKDRLRLSDRIHEGLVPVKGARIVELPAREELALWHYSYHSLEDLVEKTNRYTSIEARQAGDRKHKRARPLTMLREAGRNLWVEYISQAGWRDGTPALAVAVTRAYYRFLSLAKIWDEPGRVGRLESYEASKRRLLGMPPADATPAPPSADPEG